MRSQDAFLTQYMNRDYIPNLRGLGFVAEEKIKSVMNTLQKILRFSPWLLLCVILLVAFWIRIQGVPNIPEGQFTGSVSPQIKFDFERGMWYHL